MEAQEIDVALDELENRLDRLRSLYEQYFLGIEKIEPAVARKDVDRRFWILRRTQIRNTARRFRMQVLLQRYNTFQQYWARICREIENGTYTRHLLRAKKKFGGEPKTWAAKRRLGYFRRGANGEPVEDAESETLNGDSQAPDSLADSAFPKPRDDGARTVETIADLSLLGEELGTLDLELDEQERRPAAEPVASPAQPTSPVAAASRAAAPGGRLRLPSRPDGVLGELRKAPPPSKAPPLPQRVAKPPLPGAKSSAPVATATAEPPRTSKPIAASPAASKPAAPNGARAAAPAAGPQPAAFGTAPTNATKPVAKTLPAANATKLAAPASGAKPATPLAVSPAGAAKPAGAPSAPKPPAAVAATATAPKPAAAVKSPAATIAAKLGAPNVPKSAAAVPAAAARPAQASQPRGDVPRTTNPEPAKPAPRVEPASPGMLSDDRVRQLHGELVATKQRLNQGNSVSIDALGKTLRETERKLREQHQGRSVDFAVVVKDGKPVVKPVVRK